MNTRSLRTLAAVATAIILISIGVFLANRSGDTGTSAQPTTSATSAVQPASATSAPQPTSAAQPASATSAAQPASYAISTDQASSIALASAPGATLKVAPTLVSYQGATVYEVTLDTGLVYVDATSGQVVASTATNATTTGTTSGQGGQGGEGGEGGEEGEEGEDDEDDED